MNNNANGTSSLLGDGNANLHALALRAKAAQALRKSPPFALQRVAKTKLALTDQKCTQHRNYLNVEIQRSILSSFPLSIIADTIQLGYFEFVLIFLDSKPNALSEWFVEGHVMIMNRGERN